MKEWREVPGYEGRYEVSDTGEVYSVRSDKILRPALRLGYPQVILCREGYRSPQRVHRIVLNAFIGDSKLGVNHKDGNKSNNALNNLEYCTQKENVLHAYRLGLKTNRGAINPKSKLLKTDVINIRNLINKKELSKKEIANIYDVSASTIYDIGLGRTWKHLCCPICENDSHKCTCNVAVPGENSVSEV